MGCDGRHKTISKGRNYMCIGKGFKFFALLQSWKVCFFPLFIGFAKGKTMLHAINRFAKPDPLHALPPLLGGYSLGDSFASPAYFFPNLAAVFLVGYFKAHVRLALVTANSGRAHVNTFIFRGNSGSSAHNLLPFCYPADVNCYLIATSTRNESLHASNKNHNIYCAVATIYVASQRSTTIVNSASQAEGCGFKSRFPLQISK